MERKLEREERLKKMNEVERATEQKKLDEMKRKHNDHPKVHHPGSKDQLEDVWEEQDGMDRKDFDPKTFFYLHDVNGDGVLDEKEVESLFELELDKLYRQHKDIDEGDMLRRIEEMNRMREHLVKEVDTNGDRMISLEEFIVSRNQDGFLDDKGWEDLEDEEQFSDEEYEKFQKEYHDKHKVNILCSHSWISCQYLLHAIAAIYS
ncbi:hypothetical protein NP493_1104g03003 [Ridgeia piscesae]|uniref:EF-hand domain-containing protein n=1 Tax=Ridgeia piscesae TaxID=27915 RepID=A0AAD9KGZ5_RIDPI|nr:hypothetical protein NP493_1104g03003 [Ridgeia piscesae]